MMIRLFFAITVALIAVVATVSAQKTKSDLEAAKLLGPVMSVRSVSTDYAGEKTTGPGIMQRGGDFITYDSAGRETERKPVSDFGEAMGSILRKHDEAGRLIESQWMDPKGNLQRKDVYEYADQRLVQELSYDRTSKLIEKTVKTYTPDGMLDYESYYDPITAAAKTIFKYDDSRRPIEVAFFLTNGAKAVAPVGPCLGAHRVVYEYHPKGRVSKQSFFATDGTRKKAHRWAYDVKGNVTQYEIESDSSTTKFVYRYEFDSFGNWTKSIATSTGLQKGPTVFGKPDTPYIRTTVTKREIVYY
jgi:hypothetical protein